MGEIEDKATFWSSTLKSIVQTVGVSGVILGLLLFGLYKIAVRAVDMVEPQIERLTTETVNNIRSQSETNQKLAETQQRQSELLNGLHTKVDGVTVRIERIETKIDGRSAN